MLDATPVSFVHYTARAPVKKEKKIEEKYENSDVAADEKVSTIVKSMYSNPLLIAIFINSSLSLVAIILSIVTLNRH